jgi:hypothetical protein
MTEVLLRDLIEIPGEVHSGDFVLTLADGVGAESTITDYVVTPQLAECFDRALGLIKSALETSSSRAAYLEGSFGSGKSHFMAVLHAILRGDPDARGKKGLADVVARHDPWLRGRQFLLVPYHLPDSQSLDAAILGGYVAHVSKRHPGTPLPAVYKDDELIADARDLRARDGDEKFIAQLPGGDEEWDEADWNTASLDVAFAEPEGGKERRRLIGGLLAGPFKRYARTVRADQSSYITLEQGLSVISQHARDVLGYDAVVLLLDELVLWLAGYLGEQVRVNQEAQKVSKLVESAEHERPAPIVSFVPRQRDLRELVSRDVAGAVATSLFDTLKYWDGRFDSIRLDDRNLPAIVGERLLRPKDASASAAIDAAFGQAANVSPEVWDTLLDVHGDAGDRAAFRLTYPFSPAFLHAMVDISGALQRERTALKLMQQLLVDYRDTLGVGQLMPLGAIFDVLAAGADRPFTDKLRTEFEQAKRFYATRLRPHLLARHGLTGRGEAQADLSVGFRGDDLVVKTLLLAALVPNVPALRGLTASRLAALNHGSIVTMLPNQQRASVARTLKELSAQFGEIRVSGTDDPRVDLALIGVDTEGILRDAAKADDDAAKRRVTRELLWEELGLTDHDEFVTTTKVVWRGTGRRVEVVLDNVRDRDRLATSRFGPDEPGSLRVILDFPFDEGTFSPADDLNRVRRLQEDMAGEPTLVWLAHFLSEDRKADLSNLVRINYVLDRDRLLELTQNLTADDRHHAKAQLESRRSALTARLREALKRAYGVNSPEEADLGTLAEEQVLALESGLEPRMQLGQGLKSALHRLCFQLLDHRYPTHPDFDQSGREQEIKVAELETVLRIVDLAAPDKVGRAEVPRGDIATLKRIASPLKLGVTHEASFVLSHEWPQLIERKAAGRAEVSVRELRGWIDGEQPGLPGIVQDLVVACYAIQADKAWIRAGQQITAPGLTKITDDMLLRGQELPTEGEFEAASGRAEGIFGVGREPVRSARATHAIAEKVRLRGQELMLAADNLIGQLEAHAATLGLDDSAPRLATARDVRALLDQLAAATDATKALRLLAAADLPRENAIYRAHLASAGTLAGELRGRNWKILDELASRTASDNDPAAAGILAELRTAARRDEHELELADPLHRAEQAALDLLMSRAATPASPVISDIAAGSATRRLPGTITRRVPAGKVSAVMAEIRDAADTNRDAEFEITWRVVTD